MKHAGQEALDRLDPLLGELRATPDLKEKNRGTFYRGSRALLHFHEDGSDLFVDLRTEAAWERLRVTTAREQASLLKRVRRG